MSNKTERCINSELREIQSEINILQKAFKKKQKERDDIIIDNNKYKVDGFIYVTKASDDNYYEIKSSSDMNRLYDYHHIYRREVENPKVVEILLNNLLGDCMFEYIHASSLKNLIKVVDGICTAYSKTIISSVNEYIKNELIASNEID
jgi:phage-related tail protein